MVAEPVIPYTGSIHFRLLITSCDGNIKTSPSILCRICAHITYVRNFLQKPARLPANHDHFIERNSHYLSSVAMVSKRRCDHLKAAREASVASFKKRRFEASSFPTLDQCEIDDNKLSTTDTSDTEDDSRT